MLKSWKCQRKAFSKPEDRQHFGGLFKQSFVFINGKKLVIDEAQ